MKKRDPVREGARDAAEAIAQFASTKDGLAALQEAKRTSRRTASTVIEDAPSAERAVLLRELGHSLDELAGPPRKGREPKSRALYDDWRQDGRPIGQFAADPEMLARYDAPTPAALAKRVRREVRRNGIKLPSGRPRRK